ncbi:MAG: hypothetical protein DRN88_05245 [Candidatus Hydrothermarchaeota archaeon]|nr:MAG: hypothetical protein DRN88_05245 [Candidatus Hydrothermarchaeota archaeon]
MLTYCPICKKKTLNFSYHSHKIPYFGEVLETVVSCNKCNYKHSDVLILEEKEPAKYILEITCAEDLNIRVIRSSKGVIKIPELGVTITPGAFCNGFISNVEGILLRVEEVVKFASSWNKEKAEEILSKIEEIKKGKKKVHLILEDASGNSAIVSKKVRKEKLEIQEDNQR